MQNFTRSAQSLQARAKQARHVRILPSVIDDQDISPLAFRCFAVILSCVDPKTGLSTISLPRIAQRLGCCRRTVWAAVQELIDAGHIRNTVTEVGKCATYLILSSATHDTGPTPYPIVTDADCKPEPTPEERERIEVTLEAMRNLFRPKLASAG